MRILFLLTQDLLSPSGLGRYRPLAEGLAQRGHQVRLAALHADFAHLDQRQFFQNGVQIDYVAPMHVRKSGSLKSYYSPGQLLWVSLRGALALSRLALRYPAQIVHVGKPHPMNSLAGLLACAPGRRQILFLDRDDAETGVNRFSSGVLGGLQRSILAWLEKTMPRLAAHTTTNTFFTRDALLRSGLPARRITYLSNGVERSRLAAPDPERLAALRLELGLEKKINPQPSSSLNLEIIPPVVSYIGSLSLAGHPVDLLLRAFPGILKDFPAARLLLVGGGEDLPALQRLAGELDIAQAVIFRGRVPPDEVPFYYHLSSVTTDPVLDDLAARGRSPLKLFESWACGTPFVSADVGDRRLLIGAETESQAAGLLARPGDPDSLSQVILRVLHAPQLAAQCVANGRLRVQDYLWDRLIERLEAVYRQVLLDRGLSGL